MDTQTPQEHPTQPETDVAKRSPLKTPLLLLAAVILLAAVVSGVYFWQHQKVQKLETTVAELNDDLSMKSGESIVPGDKAKQNTTDTAPAPAAQSTDELVLTAVKDYCNANVDTETKKPLVLTVGKAGPNQKTVLYSASKDFAYVNAVCSTDGTTEGSGSAYILKKVNGHWIFLYRGQMESPEATKQFNIPGDFN